MLSKLRLFCQITVFLGIIAVTYLNHYENQKVKYGGQHMIKESRILTAIDRVAGKWNNRQKVMRFVQGDVWAAQIGNIKITDPLSFLGNLARTKRFYALLFFAAVIPVIATIIFGKVFCGWICPMGLLFEMNDKLRNYLIKHGVPLPRWSVPGWFKYVVLGVGLITGLLFGVHYFFIIYPPKLVSGEIYFWITRSAFSFGMLFIFCYLAVELLAAPRVWCRSLCPGGALYTLLNRFRFIRIKNDLKKCTNCGICDRICPYQINPSKGHLSAECDHCSICVDQCPVDTLTFIAGPDREVLPQETKNRAALEAAKAAVAVFIVLSCLGMGTEAFAHHIRGLPHYGYSDNYPQTPTYEELRAVDDWEINFSFIRIFETKVCDLAVYIRNVKTGKPYQGTVTFHVYGQSEKPEDTHPFDTLLDPTNTFRVQWVYEEDGIYIMRVRFKDEQKVYVEEFKMQMGEVGFNFLWLILPGAVILILILMVFFNRRKG
jgi:ferredoxin-type protein NapH